MSAVSLREKIAAKERKEHKSFSPSLDLRIYEMAGRKKIKRSLLLNSQEIPFAFFAFFPGCNKIPAMPRAADTKHETQNTELVPLLLSWFAQSARDLPWRRTRDPYG